jgi:uncharacterized protein YfaS (alpha-2-macroglobulin family)
VRLTINLPEDGFYLMINDPLPSGLEALNQGLAITSHDSLAFSRNYYTNETAYTWKDTNYNYKEIRDGQVVFFVTERSAGRLVLEYLARAIVAGSFTALPTEMSAMYDPEVWGRSALNFIEVQSREPN